ncbi:MAG: DUF2723 domain-containing protein [Anaerolineae bacterium]|nr:DUF2723 domain-containing protein [Anaerolineae bacterium]
MALGARQRFLVRGATAGSLVPAVAALLAFLTYWRSLAPDLTWAYYGADGGELITAAVTLGVPHPPGYPTYVLLGHLFAKLPIGDIPYRFNLFSAVAMSAAIAFAGATAFQLLASSSRTRASAAFATALTFAFLSLPWQQALITEVYALNMAIVALLLWAVLTRRPAPVAGFLLGLAITAHLTSLLLVPAVLSLTARRQWPLLAAATLIGLAPFLALPVLARSGSPLVWGQPQHLDGWWWLVSGELYRPNLFAVPLGEAAARLGRWLWSEQLALPVLALIGALPLARRSEGIVSTRSILLAATGFLYLLVAASYGPPGAAVLFLPGLACAVLLLAPLFSRLGPWSLLLPTALLLLNFSTLDLSANREARNLAQPLLHEAPREAILLTEGDATTFTLWYLQEVEGQRPDIAVIDRNLFGFDWYRQQLAGRYDWLPAVASYDLDALTGVGRTVCRVQLAPGVAAMDC